MLRGTILAAWLLACIVTRAQEPRRFAGATDLVVLHVTVTDGRGRTVSGLDASAFTVFEDGQPQVLSVFRGDDVPVTVGLVLDNSISMFAVRDLLIAGAVAFASASHPGDEIFALAFNESVRAALPDGMPFTRDPSLLRRALEGVVTTRGKTALYDAIDAGVDYARAGSSPAQGAGRRQRRRRQCQRHDVRRDAGSDTGVERRHPLGTDGRRCRPLARNRRSCAASRTRLGARCSPPRTARDIARVLERVATEIRRGYTLGFVPTTPPDATFRSLRVAVSAPGQGAARTARTRAGYMRDRDRRGDEHACTRYRWLERALIAVGVWLLAWVWIDSLQAEVVPPPTRSLGAGAVADADRVVDRGSAYVGRLEIPRLNVLDIVAEGDSDVVLGAAIGHLPETPLPWEPGNSVLAGHRDSVIPPAQGRARWRRAASRHAP